MDDREGIDGADEPEIKISEPQHHAAGIPAVISSLHEVDEHLGIVRGLRALKGINQAKGFDCPGCAWPENEHRHIAEFCENGVKAIAEEATKHRITREFFAEHSVADLDGHTDYWLGQQGRLTEPMFLDEGATHYAPISWEDAYDVIADAIDDLDDPGRAAFYTSGRTSNEAAFAYQLFVRALGTNNLPDCSNMCHESSGSALNETIGIGKGSVTLDDLYESDLIVITGQNPGTNHPRMLTALERAKRNGAKIVTINPLPEAGLIRFKNPQNVRGIVGKGTPMSDHFFQIRPGGDLAFFKAVSAIMLEREERDGGVLDHDFIEQYTIGYPALKKSLKAIDWDAVDLATGLRREELEQFADLAIAAKSTIVCWAMGITQHRDAVPTIREFVNFLLLRGNIGRKGAGVCPVRGHSNVQGDRTMGIFEKPPPALLDRLELEFGFAMPRANGHDVVETIEAMDRDELDLFMAVGGNFLSATPDTETTAKAMRNVGLTVQVSTKLNRSHLITGRRALILPTLGRTERDKREGEDRFVTVEDSMGLVHASRGTLDPASKDLRSEVDIVCQLARRTLGGDSHAPWTEFSADYGRIRDSISRVIPGFENFNQRLRDSKTGFALANAPRDSRTFPTAKGKGKAVLTVNEIDPLIIPEGRLLLQTLRSHDQYNTTVYGLDDRYRGIKNGRRVVFVNPEDMKQLGYEEGELVDLVSEYDDGERRALRFRVVGFPIARQSAAAYFPEANVLVPLGSTATTSNTPTSKGVIIRLEPASAEAAPPLSERFPAAAPART